MESPAIGFAGLGLMGGPMTSRLLAAGHQVYVWNRTHAKTDVAVAAGATRCDTPRALAARTDIVLLSLFDDTAVEAVVFGDAGIAAAQGERIIVDHSTISPDSTTDFATRLAAAEAGQWIDAPVSGGVGGAQAGTLAIMCGGEARLLDRVRPILAAYAANVTLMGPVGAGQATKLCNQTIVATMIMVLAEAVRLAQDAGVDPAALPAALAGGWADSKLLEVFLPRMIDPPEQSIGGVATMLKDLESAIEAGRNASTPMPLTATAQQILRIMAARGETDADLGHLTRLYGARE